MRDVAEPDMLKKNLQLIFLANCPSKLQNAIKEEFKKEVVVNKHPLTLQQYGLDATDKLTTIGEAGEIRKLDIEEGFIHE